MCILAPGNGRLDCGTTNRRSHPHQPMARRTPTLVLLWSPHLLWVVSEVVNWQGGRVTHLRALALSLWALGGHLRRFHGVRGSASVRVRVRRPCASAGCRRGRVGWVFWVFWPSTWPRAGRWALCGYSCGGSSSSTLLASSSAYWGFEPLCLAWLIVSVCKGGASWMMWRSSVAG